MHPLVDRTRRPIVGHRGASGDAPENTLEAFALAIEQGAEALELDVRVTADGVPVVIHDPTLHRTTDLRGVVAALRLEAIRQADAGYRFTADSGATFPWRGRGVRVPTLLEVVLGFPDIPLLVELKAAEAGPPVRDLLLAVGAVERCIPVSFLEAALAVFPSPPFTLGASRRAILRLFLASAVRLPPRHSRYRLYAVPARYQDRVEVPTTRFIQTAGRLDCPVHVWTVNQPAEAERLWARGASGMITNHPGRLLAERRRLFG